MPEEFELEFDLDEISLGIEEPEEEDTGLPKAYLHLENLVMLNQVKGFAEENPDLITVPAYADKKGVPTLVGILELTSENVLTMQHLGLKVSLIREGKEPILFNKADDYVAIVKTLKENDKVELEELEVEEASTELSSLLEMEEPA